MAHLIQASNWKSAVSDQTAVGWQITLSGGAKPDGGADIIARKDGELAVVQCKHWKETLVQLKVVRELLGTKASAGFAAHEAVLFTLSSFTDEAAKFARENRITLFDGQQIAVLVEEIGAVHFPELVNPDRKFCPKCDAPMIRRQTAKPFWGCTTFPRCRGTIEISAP
jgi:restriction system protein